MKGGGTYDMQILKINPENPQQRLVNLVVESFKDGGIIAYPTDTIYGIGCDIFQKGALERLYQIKGKDPNKPLSLIVSDFKDISDYGQMTNEAFQLMKTLTPGPYTFILQASRRVPKGMLTKRKTVGIRIPDNKICIAMAQALGNPIITTSVRNPDNKLFNDAEEIAERLKGKIDLVVDGGRISPHHSTILDLTGNEPVIEREGKGDVSFLME